MVLVFGLIAITNLFLVAGSSNTVANQATAASDIASQVIENLKAQPWNSAQLNLGGAPSTAASLTVDTAGYFRSDQIPGVGIDRHPLDSHERRHCGTKFIRVRSEGTGVLVAGPLARGVHDVSHVRRPYWDASMSAASMACQENTMSTADTRQAGFSMIELLVAMVMTLIVSGAIFGLLTGGQNAFRREPELTDRQQNIRIAMDLIKRDVAGAGAGWCPSSRRSRTVADGAGGCPTGYHASGVRQRRIRTDILEVPHRVRPVPVGDAAGAALATDATWSAAANENLPLLLSRTTPPPMVSSTSGSGARDRPRRLRRPPWAGATSPPRHFRSRSRLVGCGTANLNPTGGTSAGILRCDRRPHRGIR